MEWGLSFLSFGIKVAIIRFAIYFCRFVPPPFNVGFTEAVLSSILFDVLDLIKII